MAAERIWSCSVGARWSGLDSAMLRRRPVEGARSRHPQVEKDAARIGARIGIQKLRCGCVATHFILCGAQQTCHGRTKGRVVIPLYVRWCARWTVPSRYLLAWLRRKARTTSTACQPVCRGRRTAIFTVPLSPGSVVPVGFCSSVFQIITSSLPPIPAENMVQIYSRMLLRGGLEPYLSRFRLSGSLISHQFKLPKSIKKLVPTGAQLGTLISRLRREFQCQRC